MKQLIFFVALALLSLSSTPTRDVVGIDVSHHQGTIKWVEVSREDIGFVYIKATEGATYTDPMFYRNITRTLIR